MRAAPSMLVSICSKAPRVVMYISGKDTVTAEITVAVQEKTTTAPSRPSSIPMGPCLPNNINRPRPTTVRRQDQGQDEQPVQYVLQPATVARPSSGRGNSQEKGDCRGGQHSFHTRSRAETGTCRGSGFIPPPYPGSERRAAVSVYARCLAPANQAMRKASYRSFKLLSVALLTRSLFPKLYPIFNHK